MFLCLFFTIKKAIKGNLTEKVTTIKDTMTTIKDHKEFTRQIQPKCILFFVCFFSSAWGKMAK